MINYYMVKIVNGKAMMFDLAPLLITVVAQKISWQVQGGGDRSDFKTVTRTGKNEFTCIKTNQKFEGFNGGFNPDLWAKFLDEIEADLNIKFETFLQLLAGNKDEIGDVRSFLDECLPDPTKDQIQAVKVAVHGDHEHVEFDTDEGWMVFDN